MEQIPLQLFEACQRWRSGRDSYRPAGEVIDPSRLSVSVIDTGSARSFVSRHHYAGNAFPAARMCAGLFEKQPFERERLSGVAVFSVPMNQRVIPAYFDGLPPSEGVELGRFVLLDSIAANGETWFLKRAFRVLREHLPVRGVVSYADPSERESADGRLVKRGHTGVCYRAFNGRYRGRSSPRTLLLMPDGSVASERALSKLRKQETGHAYAARQLLDRGAPQRAFGESPADWVERLIAIGFLRRQPHAGNHCFTWSL